MTHEQKISKLRIMIGETERTKKPEDEDVLSVYLDLAADKILSRLYPYMTDYTKLCDPRNGGDPIPEKYSMLQLKISAYMLNRRGSEGEVQHIENGIHRNYGDADVPEAMLAGSAPFIAVPVRR